MAENVLHDFAGDGPFAARELVHDVADDRAQSEKLGKQDLVSRVAVAGVGDRQQLIAAPLPGGFPCAWASADRRAKSGSFTRTPIDFERK